MRNHGLGNSVLKTESVRLEFRQSRRQRWMDLGTFRSLREAMKRIFDHRGNAEWSIEFLPDHIVYEGLFAESKAHQRDQHEQDETNG